MPSKDHIMSSYTKTDIANLALSHARETKLSGDVDTLNGQNAEIIRDHWEQVLRESLSIAKPAFAKKRTALSLDTETPAFEYDNQFNLPSDYVDMVRFNGEVVSISNDKYEIEGRKLLTNETEAKLVYVRYVTDTSLYDPDFINGLSMLLGARVANDKKGDKELAESLAQQGLKELEDSSAVSGQNQNRTNVRDKVLRGSRWTGYTRRYSTNDHTTDTTTI